jgi:hypothetical protein
VLRARRLSDRVCVSRNGIAEDGDSDDEDGDEEADGEDARDILFCDTIRIK